MATEAHYEVLKAVYHDLKDKKHTHGVRPNGNHIWIEQPHKENALSQVRAKLFTIQLDLRPELPLPQELVDKIYHEALMSELLEKLPKFKDRDRWRECHIYNSTKHYRQPRVFDFWIDLCVQLRRTPDASRLLWIHTRQGGDEVNKKAHLIEVLTNNGVKCDKSWTVKRLVKAL